ncbi:hypothetical protein FRC06_005533 [Ceratobasidium sp. 370]|nr:hypothetical protein FRC06_005533 [Ceratobasidium sp. 370]
MIRAAVSLRLKSYAAPIGLRAAGRVYTTPFTSVLARIACARSISYSTSSPSQQRSAIYDPASSVEDKLELVASSRPRRDFSQSKSLHVARVHRDATDEEFREAFSDLKGLVKAELIFNSGPLRDYQNTTSRGFGFLHFENEDAAAAAAQHLDEFPVRIRGYETDINPYTARATTSTEPSHSLHISGVPLDLQYLEVAETLKERCPNQKSIRFMTSRDQGFIGVVNVAFEDTESAIDAKKSLVGASLGGVELREHNIQYGRPLWDEKPTTTLMMIGTPKEPSGAEKVRRMLAALDGVTRYKIIKDQDTGDFKGTAILNCVDITTAWKILEYLNRAYPMYRIAFISSRPEHEQVSHTG